MDIEKLIKEYLAQNRVMQLATSGNNQPWVCTVHFLTDDNYNVYWMSTPQRRHSQEIAQNPKVAFTIKVHEDTDAEPYVIGLSGEGEAALLSEEEVAEIGKLYIEKSGKAPSILEDILSGENPHRFYRMKVTKFALFDTNNFPQEPRQEFIPH